MCQYLRKYNIDCLESFADIFITRILGRYVFYFTSILSEMEYNKKVLRGAKIWKELVSCPIEFESGVTPSVETVFYINMWLIIIMFPVKIKATFVGTYKWTCLTNNF